MPNENKNNKHKGLSILSAAEIENLFAPPKFNDDERALYFAINSTEEMLANRFSLLSYRVHFILLLGYCKAKNKLFVLTNNVSYNDINYIYKLYFPKSNRCHRFKIPENIRKRQCQMIMQLLSLKPYQQKTTKKLTKKAISLTPFMAYPADILRELLQYLEEQSILMPGYTTLQDIISTAIISEKKRLAKIYNQEADQNFDQTLMSFMTPKRKSISILNNIKNDPKNFKTKCMKKEIEKLESLKPLYEKTKDLLPKFKISKGNINYYASLVDYYQPWQLKRLEYNAWKIYLLCYIHQRYKKLNENPVTAFCYHVNKYQSGAKQYVKDKTDFIDLNKSSNKNIMFQAIKNYVDKSVSGQVQFGTLRKRLFKQVAKQDFSKIVNKMSQELRNETYYEWEFYQSKANKFKRNLRPLLQHLVFHGDEKHQHLLDAVNNLKTCFSENKTLGQLPLRELPKKFVPKFYKPYIYEYKESDKNLQAFELANINIDRYEFLIYKMLSQAIQDYEICVKDTLQFTPYDDHILDVNQLDNEALTLLNDMIGLNSIRSSPDAVISKIVTELEQLYEEVNENIKTGKNKHIKVNIDGTWTLPYEAIDELPNNPLFAKFPKSPILDIMKFVNDEIQMTKTFTHILKRHIRKERDDDVLLGCILARGNNMTLKMMADSSDLPYSLLKQQDAAYIRLQTLKECNDYVVERTTKLPMYKHFHIEEGVTYSSSDGSKIETLKSTIRSRYSKKYFGCHSGVSAYTLSSNHLALNADIISANESEGRYVHDFLFNNTSVIQPNVHCTDTDGTNPLNYFCLHFFKRKYAPRYRNIYKQAQLLCGTKPLSDYKDYLIKPSYQEDLTLVKKEWPNIINTLASLGSKSITQNILVHKLSSHARNCETKKAIWILNDLLMSIHVLKYVNDIKYRQYIQKCLNRGELLNRLFRAIRCYHKGKLNGKTDLEQTINNECTRLIANIIIYFNTLIMSKVVEVKEQSKQYEDADKIKKFNPTAWQHLLFQGHFKIRDKKNKIDIDKIIAALSKLKIPDG